MEKPSKQGDYAVFKLRGYEARELRDIFAPHLGNLVARARFNTDTEAADFDDEVQVEVPLENVSGLAESFAEALIEADTPARYQLLDETALQVFSFHDSLN